MGLVSSLKSIDAKKEGLIVLENKEIKELQRALLSMLMDLDSLCLENNISWGLAGGSMLGAIRHKGFIPWDDDVDIHMTRREFDRLKRILNQNSGYNSKYELKCPGDKNYIFHFPRIYKKGTVYRTLQTTDEMPNGLFIDIFIMDNIPNSKCYRQIHGMQCNFYLTAISAMRIHKCKDNLLKHTQNSPNARREVLKRVVASTLFSFRSLESWIKSADKCFSKISDENSHDVCDPSGAQHYFGEIYERADICAFKRVHFESTELPIPVGAEKILLKRYGNNYMELPSVESREKHTLVELKL